MTPVRYYGELIFPLFCESETSESGISRFRAVTVPFDRQGTGWEVAHAALFLISNESSYVNEHSLFLDGGHLGGIVRG